MSVAIKIENLSKQYRLGLVSTRTISHDLNRWWQTSILGREDPYLKIGQENKLTTHNSQITTHNSPEYVWALRDINLEIEEGEVLGIIGKNGAGKSTLLKILSKVTAPTTGIVKARGRIASLLEVGTGFHPEMTGRENIFMNGAIMGMTKIEIRKKFDEIVDFAGVERYIDTPVKRYSSGMTVRLGFAVTAHLEPEILVVDEVLAVGDAEFQRKALGKMEDISKGEGRTVLFVSHNMVAIQRLCSKVLFLEKGITSEIGLTDNIISKYISRGQTLFSERIFNNDEQNHYVTVLSARCSDINNLIKDTFSVTEEIHLNFAYKTKIEGLQFIHGLKVYNEQDINVFNSHDTKTKRNFIRNVNETYFVKCIIPKNLLNEGTYSISFALFLPQPFILYEHKMEILKFKLVDLVDGTSARGDYVGSFPGIVRPILEWSIKNKPL